MRANFRAPLLALFSLGLLFGNTPVAHAAPSITSVRLDTPNPKIGDVINWLVEVDCSGLPIQQVMMYVQDPSGVRGWLTNSYRDIKSGTLGTKATIKIPFKITDEAAAGSYKVQSVTMTCQNKTGGDYNWSGSLEDISFVLKDGSANPSTSQPKVTLIDVKTPSVKVGEQILINVAAQGTGKINNLNLMLRSPNGVEIQKYFNQYGQSVSGESSRRIENTFAFTVDEDWVGGNYKIGSIDVEGMAGIDLYNPDSEDPNPRNSTSSFARSVSIRQDINGVKSSTGQPSNGAVTQPSLGDFSITVTNPNPSQISPPEVTKITLTSDPVSAGNSFEMSLGVDGKGAYLYSANLSFSEESNLSRTFACSAPPLQKGSLSKVWDALTIKCETQRTNTAGTYVLRSINLNTTSCNIPIPNLYDQINQSCTQTPRMRYTNYNYQYNYGFVNTNPVVKNLPKNPLDGTQKITLLPASALQAPKYSSVNIESTQIKVSYPWTYEISCDYSASSGKVTSGTNDKIFNVVTISDIKPMSKVILSGTCTAQDKAKVSFTETFTSALPAAPVLPTVLSKQIDMDSVTLILSDLDQADVDYEVDATEGSIVIAGDSVEISELKPGETTTISLTMTDIYGQSASGIIGTFTTLAPPKLEAPIVKLISKKKNNYSFQFNKNKGVSYTSRGVNCVVKISGDNILVTNLVPGKTANAYLTASDDYGQKATTKFLTAKLVAR